MNGPPVKVCVELLHLDKVKGLVVVVKFFVDELVDMIGLAFHFDITLPGHQIWSRTQVCTQSHSPISIYLFKIT